jgi:hypothetical protein
MKKIFLTTILLCAGVVGTFAQEIEIIEIEKVVPVTKNGHELLPKQGDFGLSIEATPFLQYLGNMFSQSGNPYVPTFGNWGISGQYFLEDDRSIRGTLSFDFGSDITKATVQDDYAASQPGYQGLGESGQTVIDVEKYNTNFIELRADYLFHRGYHRLQAYYGGGIGVDFSSDKIKYDYANPITESNPIPSIGVGYYDGHNARPTEMKTGNTFGLSVNGVVGVEYFFAPKMSIGGEFNLGLRFSNRWQGEQTTERWDYTAGAVKEYSERFLDGNTGEIRFNTVTDGRLYINFYF